jgi:Flp pilus assembly protein TadD
MLPVTRRPARIRYAATGFFTRLFSPAARVVLAAGVAASAVTVSCGPRGNSGDAKVAPKTPAGPTSIGSQAAAGQTPSPLVDPSGVTAALQGGPSPGPARVSAETLARLRARVKEKPDDWAARIELAAVLDTAGQASEAEDVLRGALQRGHKTAQVFHALGTLYLRNGLYDGAARALEVACKLDPNDFDSHQKLGTSFAYSGRGQQAIPQFQKAVKLNPSDPNPYLGLAFANNTAQRSPFSLKFIEEYLRRGGSPGPAYGLQCRVYITMRQFEKAAEAGRKAIALLPNNPSVWFNVGVATINQPGPEKLAEAERCFRKAVELAPRWSEANFELSRVCLRQKRLDEAARLCRTAVEIQPETGKYRYQLGQILLQQGNREEGQREVQRAQELIALNQREKQLQLKVSIAPKEPSNYLELGGIYRKLGHLDLAQAAYISVLKLDPKSAVAKRQLEEVRKLAAQARTR